jgi:hypothetical protein
VFVVLCVAVPLVMLMAAAYTLRGTTMRYELDFAPLILVAGLVGWSAVSLRLVRQRAALFWTVQGIFVVTLVASVLFNVAITSTACSGTGSC